ncbi:MAG: RNA 2'-phosphotransferase, partial [Pyrinomonadaceae bacterium]
AELQEVVEQNDKKRFAFNEDGTRIRASQGHSISVKLGYEPVEPPAVLFHGTAKNNIESIRAHGLLKQERHHVHLSEDWATARKVGERYGVPIVLEIATEKMKQDGFAFFRSENGVWLTDHVPIFYINWDLNPPI